MAGQPWHRLIVALSQCHLLTYLHLAAVAGVVVTDYTDAASGTMVEQPDGGGHFTEAVLRPVVTVAAESMVERALALHAEAEKLCFIAQSVNFPVRCEPTAVTAAAARRSD
jgi:organic hydroperoxide reductase OsmC/OhrA